MSGFSFYKVIKESLPMIILFATIELVSGGFLSSLTEEMKILPGLLILIPPLLDMKGNVASSLGARLGSALHMGVVRPWKMTKDLKTNIYSALILSGVMSLTLASLSWAVCIAAIGTCIPLQTFMLVGVLTGIISGIIMTAFATVVSMYSFGKGLDPDDVVSPTLGATGDIITTICLFVVIKLLFGV